MNKSAALFTLDSLTPVEIDPNVTYETHEQAMCCFSCYLAGLVPEEHFPQNPGLFHSPCPQCGELTVWVTDPREKGANNEP